MKKQIREKHELRQLLSSVIPLTVYKGTTVLKVANGYKVLGKVVALPEDVDAAIKSAEKNLENSLK